VLELSGGWGDFPLLPIVILGTIAALLVLSAPPLKNGIGIEKISYFNANPPLYFFANLSTCVGSDNDDDRGSLLVVLEW